MHTIVFIYLYLYMYVVLPNIANFVFKYNEKLRH